jgi:hypothetical protein
MTAIASTAAFTGASAQTSAEFAELQVRVAQLEAQASETNLSFGLGGTDVTVYGFVRVEAFYDSDFIQGDLSNTAGLDTAVATDGNFDTSVRVSRLGVRSSTETDIGTIGTQLEFDLFGGEGRSELRLRHANITVGGFLVGQFWTNFMPIGQYPTTADFNGPVGIIFARVPQIRYSGEVGALGYSFSIEEAAWTSDDPVVTAAVQYSNDFFTGRLAALSGTVQEGAFEDDAYGVTASLALQPWQGGSITGTYTTGEGIGGLLIGGGAGLTPTGQANEVDGYTVEIRQEIGDHFDIGAAIGREDYENSGATAADISQLETLHVNAFWRPVDNFAVGVEYINGVRFGGDGSRLEADRVGLSVTFSF